jgi:hypothetical protein
VLLTPRKQEAEFAAETAVHSGICWRGAKAAPAVAFHSAAVTLREQIPESVHQTSCFDAFC